jgi:hypothetical protein
MNEELKRLFSNATADIPDFGRIVFGASRNASYAAASRGEFGQLVEVGRRKKVVTAPWRQRLGLDEVRG